MNMNNLAQTHEILTPQLATKVGLTKFEFYKYVKANEYEQVGHGVYAAKDTWIDELEMLHRRCPMGVFSHDEAFYYYGLTDREPLVHTLTIYSGYNAHRLKEDGYKVYTVKKELLDVGKRTVKSNQGNEIFKGIAKKWEIWRERERERDNYIRLLFYILQRFVL